MISNNNNNNNRTQDLASGKDDSIGDDNTQGRRKKPSTSTNATTAQRGQYTNSDVNNGQMQNNMSSEGLITSNGAEDQISVP